jgi:hypothetical protein
MVFYLGAWTLLLFKTFCEMIKIGYNIETKTAKEQDLFCREKNNTEYYYDYFYYSFYEEIEKLLENYKISFFEIKTDTRYCKNGNCVNSIVIEIETNNFFDKKQAKKTINNYFDNFFNKLFEDETNL